MHPEFKGIISRNVLASFLWNQYIPAPYTIYEDVFKLNSGSILTYSKEGITIREYWDMDSVIRKKEAKTFKGPEILERLKDTLINAVNLRLEADVSVGVFLSGGIDSTLVSAIAQTQASHKIKTFTIGFQEKQYNEALYAEKIAKYLGTDHHARLCTSGDAKALIEEMPMYFGEPFADNSALPMLLLSRFTREYVTVALSGDGGDELFCGYPWYEQVRKLGKLKKAAGLLNSALSKYVDYADGNQRAWRAAKFFNAYNDSNILNLGYVTAAKLIDVLMGEHMALHPELTDVDFGKVDIMEKAEFLQMKTYLQEDILAKVDRASMAYSLEARAPFLDYRIVEQSILMPLNVKYADRTLKAALKEILYQYVPKELVERPKQGFGVPLSQWLHSDFKDMIADYFEEGFLKRQGIFDYEGMRAFYKNYTDRPSVILDKIMWSILMFQVWHSERCTS